LPIEVLAPDDAPVHSGLRHGILSPLETLSQSISAIAPTTSPALTVPLVFALAGNGAWLAYAIACAATLLIALCIARFARTSASPGSLYQFATALLPPFGARTAGWALLLAYTATGSSVVGGFLNYAHVLLPAVAGHSLPGPLLAIIATVAATYFAYRDIQTSARLMLWIEAASVSMILVVLLVLLIHDGFHIDQPQLTLHQVTPSGVRLGVVLALFSFVGFESATTLGHEARNPLRTIPRAVVQSAVLAGLFFLLCCYTETLGFRQLHQDLGKSDAPFRVLSALAQVPVLGPVIDVCAFVSMFACTLACITAAARVLLKMALDGLVPSPLARAHPTHETPHFAVLTTAAAVLLPAVVLSARGVSGFITAYLLVAVALPSFLRRRGELTPSAVALSLAAAIAMALAMAGTLYPVPDAPYNWLPYIYLGYLAAGLIYFAATPRSKTASNTGSSQ
jgi:amino acid transporter